MAKMDGRRILVVTLDELAVLRTTAELRMLLIHKISRLTGASAQIP
jgi:hypothetical protein